MSREILKKHLQSLKNKVERTKQEEILLQEEYYRLRNIYIERIMRCKTQEELYILSLKCDVLRGKAKQFGLNY